MVNWNGGTDQLDCTFSLYHRRLVKRCCSFTADQAVEALRNQVSPGQGIFYSSAEKRETVQLLARMAAHDEQADLRHGASWQATNRAIKPVVIP